MMGESLMVKAKAETKIKAMRISLFICDRLIIICMVKNNIIKLG